MTRPSDEKLAKALEDAGHKDLAARAREGEWNDFFGQHAAPKAELISTLRTRSNARALIDRTKNGDFDSDKDESNEWAQSEEGRRVLTEAGVTIPSPHKKPREPKEGGRWPEAPADASPHRVSGLSDIGDEEMD